MKAEGHGGQESKFGARNCRWGPEPVGKGENKNVITVKVTLC